MGLYEAGDISLLPCEVHLLQDTPPHGHEVLDQVRAHDHRGDGYFAHRHARFLDLLHGVFRYKKPEEGAKGEPP